MKIRFRAWLLGAILVCVLVGLLIFAPPDGTQRAELSQFVGRFHPVAVHFPIALLLLVPILELASLFHTRRELRQSAGFVLAFSAIAAVASAWLGWLLARSGGYEGSIVTQHMWGGVSLAAATLVCYGLRGWNRPIYLAGLLATLGLMAWTSDQGGKLTHGATFLTEHAPEPFVRWFGAKAKLDVDPNSFYALRVHPIFEAKCVQCHDGDKFKGSLRLDNYGNLMKGGKDGQVVHPGDTAGNELLRRVKLPPQEKGFMPAEGKPALTAEEIKLLEVWIAAGATPQISEAATKSLPAPIHKEPAVLFAADYRPQSKTISDLEALLGVQLVPRSQNPTDGLILRTTSAPGRCDDSTLERLAPVASLIVDAELARTKVTDKGLATLASFSNLRFLDLSHTAVTSAGMKPLAKLDKLESLNLTDTKVTPEAVADLKAKPNLKRIYKM